MESRKMVLMKLSAGQQWICKDRELTYGHVGWGRRGWDIWRVTWKHAFSSVQSLSPVRLFATPWTTACQTSLSITNSWSLLKLMSIESVMPSSHLIVSHPRLLPSIFPSIRVFSSESALCIRWPKYWSFSFTISLPMKI